MTKTISWIKKTVPSFRVHSPLVTLKVLNSDWSRFKELAKSALEREDLAEAFRLLEGMGYFGWKYNFLPSFADDEMEQLIIRPALKLNPPLTATPIANKKIVFYDFFALENRGFTQQYLEVIIKNNFELLYVIEDESNYHIDSAIIKTIDNYDKASILVLSSALSKSEKLVKLLEEISTYCPSKIFIHNSPWDILSCCFCYLLKGSGIKTYLLNITDHTFWPGKNCFSYFIDFRQYGSQINKELRQIPPSQLLLIPTPSFNQVVNRSAFKGFPVSTENKIIGFAGGAFYKILDEKNTFLNLIKKVLDDNPNLIFLFANVDGDNGLSHFIVKNKLEDRFVLIGNRTDIDEVFRRIDIYFNTYPYGGGLMMQYAVTNKKPILSYWNKDLMHTRLDKVFDEILDDKYIIDGEEKYLEIAGKLINDKQYRNEYGTGLCKRNIREEFEEKLSMLLKDESLPPISYSGDFIIDTRAIADFHIHNDKLHSNEYTLLANQFLAKRFFVIDKKLRSIKKNPSIVISKISRVFSKK